MQNEDPFKEQFLWVFKCVLPDDSQSSLMDIFSKV